MTIKNIILDLGGVIINLDLQATIQAFNKLSALPFETLYTQSCQVPLFNRFDKGEIDEQTFFAQLQKEIGHQGEAIELLDAWNAMLLDVPAQRLETLQSLKRNYRTFLLSNTCETHIAAFEKQLKHTHGLSNFEPYFERVYYSCRMGMRKPDAEIFERVLKENSLPASETLFIDDSEQHVKGAAKAGIHARLLPKGKELAVLLSELDLL